MSLFTHPPFVPKTAVTIASVMLAGTLAKIGKGAGDTARLFFEVFAYPTQAATNEDPDDVSVRVGFAHSCV